MKQLKSKPGDPLTRRQEQVLRTIVRLFKKYRRPPSYRELGDELGIGSPNGVSVNLKALEKKGRIKIVRDASARAIRLVGFDVCPCCGKEA